MSTDPVHPSAVGTNTKSHHGTESHDYTDDPSIPPQRHAGAVGIGPNYTLGPGFGDQVGGIVEEIKGKIVGKPEVAEHGRERRTGELMRKERERYNAVDPFKVPKAEER
ncbi:hypothetical protein HD554DRAFT_2119585 [Boletus coccyginus]|nr:hypothetical protein HD554DRAFT_2119585 [Boletus coccyginus]